MMAVEANAEVVCRLDRENNSVTSKGSYND